MQPTTKTQEEKVANRSQAMRKKPAYSSTYSLIVLVTPSLYPYSLSAVLILFNVQRPTTTATMSLSFVSKSIQKATDDGGFEETPIENGEETGGGGSGVTEAAKPLFDQLREHREREEAEREEFERNVMRGTLALDDDDAAHLDSVLKRRDDQRRQVRDHTATELASFRAAQADRIRQQQYQQEEEEESEDDNDGDGVRGGEPPKAADTAFGATTASTTTFLKKKAVPAIIVKKKRRRMDDNRGNNSGDVAAAKQTKKEKKKEEVGGEGKARKEEGGGEEQREPLKAEAPAAAPLGDLLAGYGSSSSSCSSE